MISVRRDLFPVKNVNTLKYETDIIDGFAFLSFASLEELLRGIDDDAVTEPLTNLEDVSTTLRSSRPALSQRNEKEKLSSAGGDRKARLTLSDVCKLYAEEKLVSFHRQVVMAKTKSYPFWPGVVLRLGSEIVIRYLGEDTFTYLEDAMVKPFNPSSIPSYLCKFNRKNRRDFLYAFCEALFIKKIHGRKSNWRRGHTRRGMLKRKRLQHHPGCLVDGKNWFKFIDINETCLKVDSVDSENAALRQNNNNKDNHESGAVEVREKMKFLQSLAGPPNCGRCRNCKYGRQTKRKKLTCLTKLRRIRKDHFDQDIGTSRMPLHATTKNVEQIEPALGCDVEPTLPASVHLKASQTATCLKEVPFVPPLTRKQTSQKVFELRALSSIYKGAIDSSGTIQKALCRLPLKKRSLSFHNGNQAGGSVSQRANFLAYLRRQSPEVASKHLGWKINTATPKEPNFPRIEAVTLKRPKVEKRGLLNLPTTGNEGSDDAANQASILKTLKRSNVEKRRRLNSPTDDYEALEGTANRSSTLKTLKRPDAEEGRLFNSSTPVDEASTGVSSNHPSILETLNLVPKVDGKNGAGNAILKERDVEGTTGPKYLLRSCFKPKPSRNEDIPIGHLSQDVEKRKERKTKIGQRGRFSTEEVAVLYAEFVKGPRPGKRRLDNIAEQLRVHVNRINHWFSMQRVRAKRESKYLDSLSRNKLGSCQSWSNFSHSASSSSSIATSFGEPETPTNLENRSSHPRYSFRNFVGIKPYVIVTGDSNSSSFSEDDWRVEEDGERDASLSLNLLETIAADHAYCQQLWAL